MREQLIQSLIAQGKTRAEAAELVNRSNVDVVGGNVSKPKKAVKKKAKK